MLSISTGTTLCATPGSNISLYARPTIYSLRHLINYYTRSKRLLFFFDLHGHPRSMGSFLYGNAMDDVVSQTETCLFAKLLSVNSQTFEFNECIFSKMEMKCRVPLID